MELAVIGREDFCMGFSLSGIRHIFETESPSEAVQKVISNQEIGVVVFDESLSERLDEFERVKLEASIRPVFVMLSLKEESDELKRMIKKSIGIEL